VLGGKRSFGLVDISVDFGGRVALQQAACVLLGMRGNAIV